MNVENFLDVVSSLRDDFYKQKTVEKLNSITGLINDYIKDYVPEKKHELEMAIEELYASLDGFSLNEYNFLEKSVLDEIGAFDKFGRGLKQRIEKVVEEYNSSPALLVRLFGHIHSDTASFFNNINTLIPNLGKLGVVKRTVRSDVVELNIVFPDDVSLFTVGRLEKELRSIKLMISTISEIVGTEGNEFQISSIGSSKLTLAIKVTIGVALVLSKIVTGFLGTYNDYLDVKLKTKQLEEKNLPNDIVETLKKANEDKFRDALEKILDSVLREQLKKRMDIDEGRKNELEVGGRGVIEKISQKINDGVTIDFNIRPAAEAEKTDSVNFSSEAPSGFDECKFCEDIAELKRLNRQIMLSTTVDHPVLSIASAEKG